MKALNPISVQTLTRIRCLIKKFHNDKDYDKYTFTRLIQHLCVLYRSLQESVSRYNTVSRKNLEIASEKNMNISQIFNLVKTILIENNIDPSSKCKDEILNDLCNLVENFKIDSNTQIFNCNLNPEIKITGN